MADFRTAFRTNFLAVITGDSTLTDLLGNGASSVFYALPAETAQYPCMAYMVTGMTPEGPLTPRTPYILAIDLEIHARNPNDGDDIQGALETLIEGDSFAEQTLSDSDVTVLSLDMVGDWDFSLDPRHLARSQVVEIRTLSIAAKICPTPA